MPGKEEERMLVTVFDKKINIAKVDQEDTLAFGFDTMTLLPMTTTVLQQTTTLRGVGQDKDVGMYHALHALLNWRPG